MKSITKSYQIGLSALALSTLLSCGGAAGIVSTPVENIDKRPLKTTKLSDEQLKRWSHLDIDKDTVPGMSVDRAYNELLKGKKGSRVVVAVIDSGIDIDHEDLKQYIWTNSKEIANNGKDDDNNGYTDDIHGWNFLGKSENETLEMTRIVKKGDDGSAQYKAAKAALDKETADALGNKQQLDFILNADKTIKNNLKKTTYTLDDVKAIKPAESDTELNQAKQVMTQVLTNIGSYTEFEKEMVEFKDYVYDRVNYNLNTNYDGRKPVGDNPNNINDKSYGNPSVKGVDLKHADHGTHVSGIIAQGRANKKGGDGVINNVSIMALRAVPNGDEYDKDIALAIRYAVDNGAKVINGSFGKSFSPNKEWVFEALKYAASKDVLFVHAAGNDSQDIDVEENFPNDSADKINEFCNNVVTVGALSPTYGTGMVASFSNYGKRNVDVFAPGDKIYATIPNNQYKYLQGTSMASPNVAGVAALIRSHYPKLTAAQVKEILIKSVTPITIPVMVGENKENKRFNEICTSGGIVNAYKALQMAEQLSKK